MVRTKAPKGDEAFKLVLDDDETELRLRLAPGTASGFYGVKKARKMWQATIYVSGKAVPQRDLGSFTRAIDAAVAVARAKRDNFIPPTPPKDRATRGSGSGILLSLSRPSRSNTHVVCVAGEKKSKKQRLEKIMAEVRLPKPAPSSSPVLLEPVLEEQSSDSRVPLAVPVRVPVVCESSFVPIPVALAPTVGWGA
jgi:hypothetical protein